MHDTNRRYGFATVLLALSLGVSATSGMCQVTISAVVPGTSDPWLAGMPTGSIASCLFSLCDTVPTESPVLIDNLCLVPGEPLVFEASGGVSIDPGLPLYPPDGDVSWTVWHDAGAEDSISNIYAPIDCLVGVFLNDAQPNSSPAPPSLEFGTLLSRDYLSLSPLLKQVFFIGDGLTSAGEVQRVLVPSGATRLFLGTMDSCGWYNNGGQFNVQLTVSCGPTTVNGTTWGRIKSMFR